MRLLPVVSDMWAMHKPQLEALIDILAEDIHAKKMTPSSETKIRNTDGDIAIINISGTIVKRHDFFSMLFGDTSTQEVEQAIIAAAKDSTIKAIMLYIDSPGGTISGLQELSDAIVKAKGDKPVIAQVDGMAASAAYWIASQATEIVVTPSGEVGGIGVYIAHLDKSKAMENEGYKVKLIKAGKYKTEANPFEPLGDDAEEYLQQRVDKVYDKFISTVAEGRGVDKKIVLETYGKGRLLDAEEALKAGMVDRIATVRDTLDRFFSEAARQERQRRMAKHR